MLRLWVPAGERIESAHRLNIGIAGAEANVAVALARMGRSSGWLSRLPDNPLGRRTARSLAAHGVDTSGISWADEGRMGTYYVELSGRPRPVTVVYDRSGSATTQMTPADIDWSMVEGARVAFVSGITPALSESCAEATAEFMSRASEAGATVAFDVNYRARLWNPEQARPVLGDLCRLADVVISAEEDARDIFLLDGSVEDLIEGMAAISDSDHIVITRGANGAAWRSGDAGGRVKPFEADVVDPIGAGDAFAAGVIIGILDDDPAEGVAIGSAMGALEVGLYGDVFTIDPEEVESVRSGAGRDVSR